MNSKINAVFKALTKTRKRIVLVLMMLLVDAYPCAFIYFNNIDEVNIAGAIGPFLLFVAVSAVVGMITFRIMKEGSKAGLFTAVFMMIFMNYMVIQKLVNKILPFLSYLLFLILVIVLLVLLFKKINKSEADLYTWCQIITFVCGGLVLFNGLAAIPKVINEHKTVKRLDVSQYAVNKNVKNNVYYFIFDEYGGYENLKYYYGYDNSKFYEDLVSEGFSVSKNTYNREGIMTRDIVPNILNLDYVTDVNKLEKQCLDYLNQPVLYRFFEDMGYQINMINHDNYLLANGCNEISEYKGSSRKNETREMLEKILENSAFDFIDLKIRRQFKHDIDDDKIENIQVVIEDLKNAYKYTDGKPTFTIGYIQLPHNPFIFKSDGTISPDKLYNQWNKKEKYIEQLKYTNSLIKEIVDNIKKNDPKATIVIQSDHGARYPYFCMVEYKSDQYNEVVETEKMQNALNVVYNGEDGKVIDISGLSAINTWRTILNTNYGTNYKMLDEPHDFVFKWYFTDSYR